MAAAAVSAAGAAIRPSSGGKAGRPGKRERGASAAGEAAGAGKRKRGAGAAGESGPAAGESVEANLAEDVQLRLRQGRLQLAAW